MHFGTIKYFDIANGEGVRTSLFVSGCTHHCPHCFQPQTWDFSFGEAFTEATLNAILESLAPRYVDGLTILGGEPMEPANQEGIAPLVKAVRAQYPHKTIWIYTGDIYEDLIDERSPRHTPFTSDILSCIDVLVDGPFIEAKKDITLRFCGSSNQRLIDVPKTLAEKRVVLWHDKPLYSTHSWVPHTQ